MQLLQSMQIERASWITGVARDRVVQALIFGMLSLGLIDAAQLLPSLEFILLAIWGMLPFFLIALVLAGSIRAAGADAVIARLFSGHPVKSIILAASFGAISPFCSLAPTAVVQGWKPRCLHDSKYSELKTRFLLLLDSR